MADSVGRSTPSWLVRALPQFRPIPQFVGGRWSMAAGSTEIAMPPAAQRPSTCFVETCGLVGNDDDLMKVMAPPPIAAKEAQKRNGEQTVYLLAGRRLPTLAGNGCICTIPDQYVIVGRRIARVKPIASGKTPRPSSSVSTVSPLCGLQLARHTTSILPSWSGPGHFSVRFCKKMLDRSWLRVDYTSHREETRALVRGPGLYRSSRTCQ